MAKFPLFRLDDLIFDDIYPLLDELDLLTVVECCPLAATIIKAPRKQLPNYHIEIAVEKTKAWLTLFRDDEKVLKWTICLKRHHVIANTIQFEERQVAGKTWRVAMTPKTLPTNWLSVNHYDTFESDILRIAEHFKKVFRCSVKKIVLDMGETHSFKKLLVDSPALRVAECIEVSKVVFTKEEMDFMMGNFVTEKLIFEGTAGKDYKYQKPLNFPIVKLSFARWIGDEELLEMVRHHKQIGLEDTKVTNEGLNQLIINWLGGSGLAGDDKALEFVEVSRETGEERSVFDIEAIMKGIEYTPGVEKWDYLFKNFLSTNHRFQDGMDIRREDGKVATIIVTQRGYADMFFMAVWSDPYPDKV